MFYVAIFSIDMRSLFYKGPLTDTNIYIYKHFPPILFIWIFSYLNNFHYLLTNVIS